MQKNQTSGQNAAHLTAYSILIMVGMGHLLNDMMQSVIPALYPILKQSHSFSFTQIGILNLVYQLTSSLLQPMVGIYIDRRKRPYLLAGGMLFTLAGLLVLSTAGSFASLLLAVSVVGCGSSIFHPGAARLAQQASGGKKGLAQSIFQVGGNAGSAFGPLLAALIIEPFEQYSVSWFAVAAFFAMLLLAHTGRWYKQHSGTAVQTIQPQTANGEALSKNKIRWAMIMLMILIFSKYFYIASITNYFTFYLIECFGLSVQQSQFGLFAFLAASTIGTLIGGGIGDRYGRKPVIWGSILGAAPFALALPHATLWGTIILAIIIGFVISSAFSAIVVYATDLMPTRVGVISGVFYGFMFGLGGVASAFWGWMADFAGIEQVFNLCAWLPLLGIVALWLPNVKSE